MSRLVIDVTGEQHQQIKALAALKGQSMKDFILDKLFDDHINDEKAAWDELEDLLLKRIQTAETGALSKKTMREIAESKAKDLEAE